MNLQVLIRLGPPPAYLTLTILAKEVEQVEDAPSEAAADQASLFLQALLALGQEVVRELVGSVFRRDVV